MRPSRLVGRHRHCSRSCVSTSHPSSSFFEAVLCPASESPLVHGVGSTQPNTQRGPLYRSVKFSFSVPLSSLVRCSGNSTRFVLPCLLHLGNPFVSTWVPLWVLWPGNTGTWDNCKAYRGPLPLDVLCPVFWKILVHMFHPFLFVPGGRVNFVPIIPSWVEAEVLHVLLKYKYLHGCN